MSEGRMEKLEEILRAEEDARHLLHEAQDHAAEIERQAYADVERINTEAKASARRELAAVRKKVLASADEEAARIASHAERELGDVVRAADSRVDEAIEAVVSEITE
jgi:vacuolar-type H+-ATPase subunit H